MTTTIYALATGSLGCAVAIIRVSGPRASQIARSMCGKALKPRMAEFRPFQDPVSGEAIDTGLALFFPGPASFTGEDCLELQCHGSRAVVARLLACLGRFPETRLAEPGEFIRRAFENGKLALSTVEGVADLIDARTEAQRRQALIQAGGGLAAKADNWRACLLEAAALIEAELDFADEGEAPSLVLPRVREIVAALAADLAQELENAERGLRIRHGYRVVIAGPPNAGKSTLLNALARRDVAIVTSHAGTTRDVIEVELDLHGLPVIVADTAGLRETDDEVEAIGVERSRSAMARADLILWLSAERAGPEVERDGRMLLVATKIDLLGSRPAWADLCLSALNGVGLEDLVAEIRTRAEASLNGEPALITHERQRQQIRLAYGHLSSLLAENAPGLEFVAEDLRSAIVALEILVGRVSAEDVLGGIFSRFCMGK